MKISGNIRYTPLFKGCTGQDGAIWGDNIFRFDADGSCKVFSIEKQAMISEFMLDRLDAFVPHSNAVSFGAQKYAPEDEFPVIYTNIYNNCAKEADRLEGTLCAYRLTREGDSFTARLVQAIRVGFVEELDMWKSLPGNGDVRSYGNLAADPVRGKLYAFVMRDAPHTTRYFEFDMPDLMAGAMWAEKGVKLVTLDKADVISCFDGPYSNYLQGACAYGGKLFSVEGFNVNSADEVNKPRMQVIDMEARKQIADIDLYAAGLSIEPELIDFENGVLYYMDASGAVYTFEFE